MYTVQPATGKVFRDSDGAVCAPAQSVNDPLFREYCDWVYAGNQPAVDPTVPKEAMPVPDKVTPRQIRLALNTVGMRQAVEDAVAAADQNTKDTWEFASEILRGDPLMNSMAQAMGMTDEQLDDLFRLADTF